ncbi:MAG: outer-membrane lipoprotein carrier protein LolA [Acidobacteriaceae bacterium]
MKIIFRTDRGRVAAMMLVMLGIVMGAALLHAQTGTNAELDKVLTQMDAASAKFRSAQANFQWDQFERVVSSTSTQAGVIYFERTGNSTRMAADIETADGQPAKKYLVFRDGVLKFFQSQIDQLTVFHAGNKQGQYESYLTLGFGGSGSDLKKSWDVTYQGMEAIDGVQTAKLDLVSKSEGVRNNFSHVTIWVDPTRAISLKQVLFEPSGDTRTSYFRNIQYNKKVPASVFKIKTDTKTQVIQK